MIKDNSKSYLTPNEVAEMLMLSVASVRQWAQKGDLKALTTPGGHRRFLPKDVAEFAKQRNIKLNQKNAKQVKVLIIDDNVSLSGYLVALLASKDNHFITEQAFDGFEAGNKVYLFNPDIILLDMIMPGISGLQVCKNLKANERTAKIRVIAMTGSASQDKMAEIIAAGAEQCLAKPIDQDKLFAILN